MHAQTSWSTRLSRPVATMAALLIPLAACSDASQPFEPHAVAVDLASAKSGGFPPWIQMESSVDNTIEDVWGSAPDHVFTVGVSGSIQHFDGTRWTSQSAGTTSSFRAVWGSSADDVWAVGGLGALIHYDGSGWDLVDRLRTDAGSRYQLFGIWGSAADDVWAVGNTGTSHHFDGSTWTYDRVPTGEVLRSVWGTGPDNVFTVGDGGVIFHTEGAGWTAMESPTGARMNAVHGRSGTDVFAAGSFGVILHFDGERWVEDPQSRVITRAHIRDLWSDGAGNIFAAAWGGVILRHDGRVWHHMLTGTGQNVEGGWASPNGRLFAGGANGMVLNGGRGIGFGHRPPGLEAEPIWPLSGVADADADSVHDPYGPRLLPGGYDFHAGIDLPARRGTPVLAVLPGEVIDVRTWNGSSSGSGNAVSIRHESGRVTAYLHLDEIHVEEGAWLEQGAQLGTVGSTGASYSHLHLGYLNTLNFSSMDERQSYNPLELLVHDRPERIDATFADGGVVLHVPLQRMTIRSIELVGAEDSRVFDYYEVVRSGSSSRDNQVQNGIHVDVTDPTAGWFDLSLRAEDFATEHVVVTGIDGRTLLEASRHPGASGGE